MSSHENLSVVLIESTLVISDCWHVLDNDGVIWVFARTVENSVGLDHVINNIRLGNLLGAELLVRAEILSIVITKVIVAGNGSKLDTSTDQEVNESRLHLGLTRLEIVTTNESTVLFSKLNSTWNKGVLRRPVDEWDTLENGSNCKDCRWGNFLVTLLDCLQQVLGSVVHTIDELSKTFGIGSPLDNDLVKTVVSFELTINKSAISRCGFSKFTYRISFRICST